MHGDYVSMPGAGQENDGFSDHLDNRQGYPKNMCVCACLWGACMCVSE